VQQSRKKRDTATAFVALYMINPGIVKQELRQSLLFRFSVQIKISPDKMIRSMQKNACHQFLKKFDKDSNCKYKMLLFDNVECGI
jgi:hypothetical protein